MNSRDLRTFNHLVKIAQEDIKDIEKKIDAATSIEELEKLEKQLESLKANPAGDAAKPADAEAKPDAEPTEDTKPADASKQEEKTPEPPPLLTQKSEDVKPIDSIDAPEDLKEEIKKLQEDMNAIKENINADKEKSKLEKQIDDLKKQIQLKIPSINIAEVNHLKRSFRRITGLDPIAIVLMAQTNYKGHTSGPSVSSISDHIRSYGQYLNADDLKAILRFNNIKLRSSQPDALQKLYESLKKVTTKLTTIDKDYLKRSFRRMTAKDDILKMMPAGSDRGYDGSYYSWGKRGGYAGDKMIASFVAKILQAGWKKKEFKPTSVPDGSYMGSGTIYISPDKKYEATASRNFGPVASDNRYHINVKKLVND